MKRTGRMFAAFLAAAMTLAPCAAYGAEGPTPKEEVVYVNLSSSGSVASVEVVNIFDMEKPGLVVDYGDYESVRNMTSTEALAMHDDCISVNAGAGRLYYEGSLPGAEIPWLFSLQYKLNGVNYAADAIAGASGQLEIHLTAKENPRCRGGFFDSFALQISVTLDGDKCQDIAAEGATVANVGSDKQLNFTILPGQGADITVTAQVTDFSMDPIAINGIPLSLDVQVDDQELQDQVQSLLEAVTALDEGAGTLSDGAQELGTGADDAVTGAEALYAGAASLQSGAGQLKSGGESVQSGAASVSSGASEVNDGAQALKGGLDTLGAGLSALNDKSAELTDGSALVLAALQSIQASLSGEGSVDTEAITATLDGLESRVDSLTTILSSMSGLSDSLTGVLTSLRTVSGSLQEFIDRRPDDSDLQDQLGALKEDLDRAIESYLNILVFELLPLQNEMDVETFQTELGKAKEDCLGQLSGVTGSLDALKNGVDTLTAQYADLNDGVLAYAAGVTAAYDGYTQLAPGAASLAEGSAALAEGADELYSGASDLAGGISDVYTATGTLTAGAGELDTGVGALAEGITALGEGAGEMKEGAAALAEGTDGMDGKIQQKIDDMLASVTGQTAKLVSFVSEKNTNVQAVQFVIRTPAIQRPAQTEAAPEPVEESTFWDKLIALF